MLLPLLFILSLLALTIGTILPEGRTTWRSEDDEKDGKEEKRAREKEEKQGVEEEKNDSKEETKRTKKGEQRKRKRLRRQSLPTDNVHVYASNSNVSVTDRVQVLSKESQIRILERNLNTTVWSNASLLQVSSNKEQISLSASQAVALVMKLGAGAQMEGTGDTLQLNESNGSAAKTVFSVHPGTVVYSRVEAQLTGKRVNLSWADLASRAIAFRASGARVAAVIATDWTRENVQEEVRVLSTPADKGEERELSVVAISAEYQIQIRLIGAESALLFHNSLLQIPSDHRSLLLDALDWQVTVRSALSPFELHATESRLQVNCFNEALSLTLLPDALQLHIGHSSALTIVRSHSVPGKVRVNGALLRSSANATAAAVNSSPLLIGRIEMISRELRLSLSRNDSIGTDQTAANVGDQSLLIDADHSNLRLLHSNRTIASLTAEKHFVEILGGKPSLHVSTGNISVEMQMREERKPMVELSTDIVPKELLKTDNVGDFFGIGPFVSEPTHANTSTTRPVLTLSSPVPLTSAPLPSSTIPPTVNWSPPSVPATPQMADPSELFTFRHTFHSSFTSVPPPATTGIEAEMFVQLNDSMAAFPSPDSELFTFAPTVVPDADFLVGQFDTVPPSSKNEQHTIQSLFPLSATISALQLPEDEDEQQQQKHIAEQFPGIRRENLLIWRPEQMAEMEESDGGGKLETYLVDEQQQRQGEEKREGEQEKRPRRTLRTDGGMTEEQALISATMEVDIAVEREEDVRAERLRRELREGIERMLGECVLVGEKKRVRATNRDKIAGGKAIRETNKEAEEENVSRENENGTEKVLRLTGLQMEYLGRLNVSTNMEMVKMHFTLAGGRKELEKGIKRIGEMDRERASEALQHEVLSKPHLSVDEGSASVVPSSPFSTLSAISARSLPVLLLGSLCLSAALLTMLIVLRPFARAFLRVKQWMKRRKGSEWKVKQIGGKWAARRREMEEGNGGGIFPM